MKVMRKIIEIDDELCNGCGECVPACAEGALEIIDGKARMLAEKYCDGLGACLGECPTGALRIIEREADDFDEEAVHQLLAEKKERESNPEPVQGCPSAALRTFEPSSPCRGLQNNIAAGGNSALQHWPVQIRLVPPNAPFLKNADLLIAADCTPVAYADFHRDFLKDRVVMIGCPKFDDYESYIEKFTEIFKQGQINSVNVVIMEVPCCGGMKMIVKEALNRSGANIDASVSIISASGKLLGRENLQ